MRRLFYLLVAMIPAVLGCGTVANIAKPDKRKPYGGVAAVANRLDGYADAIQENDEAKRPHPANIEGFIGLGLTIADLALSAVGDTITYPYCKWAARRRDPGRHGGSGPPAQWTITPP